MREIHCAVVDLDHYLEDAATEYRVLEQLLLALLPLPRQPAIRLVTGS